MTHRIAKDIETPKDVDDALQFIIVGLKDITLHPVDSFTHDLLFHVNIRDELYLYLKCAYTDRNFKELLEFSRVIKETQPFLNVFNPTGWKEGQKRICVIIKHWVAPVPVAPSSEPNDSAGSSIKGGV